MSWKETDKNIQLEAGLDKDRKIRAIAKWDPRRQNLLQELNELPSINYEMMRERNGVIKRE